MTKESAPEELISAIRKVSTGSRYISSKLADEMIISEKIVTTYRARILEKMNLHNNVELTLYAIENKLLPWYFSVRDLNQSNRE